MQNLDLIANELFNKIRGRFPSVTIGDAEGNVTNEPKHQSTKQPPSQKANQQKYNQPSLQSTNQYCFPHQDH